MGKKKNKNKKKQNKSINLLKSIDKSIDKTYTSLIEEIEDYQRRLNKSDKSIIKNQKKKLRKEMGVIPYYTCKERVKVREKMIKDMEKTKLLERVEKSFDNLIPIVSIIARLIAVLIVSILSIEPIRCLIKPKTLDRMTTVYKVAMSIG